MSMTLEIELSDSQLAKIADMVAAKLEGGKRTAYTVEETASMLKVSGKTVRNHIKAKIIPTVPGIGAIRIPSAYVDGLLNLGGNGE